MKYIFESVRQRKIWNHLSEGDMIVCSPGKKYSTFGIVINPGVLLGNSNYGRRGMTILWYNANKLWIEYECFYTPDVKSVVKLTKESKCQM